MTDDRIVSMIALGAPPWPTLDPFLFCVHHEDAFPRGNADMGPDAELRGRNIGMDFAGVDGWSMYHGDVVPGFPRHPHRGFETVTIGRSGWVDHSDSLGATARFGRGDVQWMTAGRGIVHSEMFPLVHREGPNPTGMFQLWLNLPAASKMVDPYFSMLWRETIPVVAIADSQGRTATVTVVAGAFGAHKAPAPPPQSWAARPQSDLAIWTIVIPAGAAVVLPAGSDDAHRVLYHVHGGAVSISGTTMDPGHAAQLRPDVETTVTCLERDVELLLLHGRPIGEPVVQHGPFVMNTPQEIQQAMVDYRRTEYGGWPWDSDGPVHARDEGRFAIHAGGKIERPA